MGLDARKRSLVDDLRITQPIELERARIRLLHLFGEIERGPRENDLHVRGLDLELERALRVDAGHLRRRERSARDTQPERALARKRVLDRGIVGDSHRPRVRRADVAPARIVAMSALSVKN